MKMPFRNLHFERIQSKEYGRINFAYVSPSRFNCLFVIVNETTTIHHSAFMFIEIRRLNGTIRNKTITTDLELGLSLLIL